MTVRLLRQSDGDAVRALDQLILGEDRSTTWDAHVNRFLELTELETLPHPPIGSHIAEVDGRIVGFLLAEVQAGQYGLPRGVWIVAVGVDPGMRRMRIGARLVEALLAQCRERGIPDIFATLSPEDERDASFLRSCGLQPSRVQVFGRSV